MNRWMIAGLSLVLVSVCFAQERKAAPAGFEEQIQGSWLAGDRVPNRLLTRLVVSKDNKGWWVEVWALRGLKEEAVQKAPLQLLRSGVGGQGEVARGLAVWQEGLGEGKASLSATLAMKEGSLIVELTKVYAEQKNPSWFVTYSLNKR